jgi:phage tail sheath gpL-like
LGLSSASASAATDSVSLNFLGVVDVEAAMQASRYQVKVNGVATAVQIVSVSVAGSSVTLGLGEDALQPGDSVEVKYQLLDGKRLLLSGASSASAR